MADIISYFGTYTPAADGAAASFKFEYLCTLGFAAIVIFLGRAIVARSAPLVRDPGSSGFRYYLFHPGLPDQGHGHRGYFL
mgnify:CR=1 FL=1